MKITYASHHSWSKQVLENSLENYGSSDQKKIKKTLALLENDNISFEFQEANDTFFDWFEPLYINSLSSRKNARIDNIKNLTVNKEGLIFKYYTLTLKEKGLPIGGCIFSDRNNRFSIAYRMFERRWNKSKAPASPALFGEFLLDEYSKQNNKARLVHGLDRNPYGINSKIGLAIFKLSTGCAPKIPSTSPELFTLDTNTITEDTLVLHYTSPGEAVTNATLIVLEENINKYEQLFKYSNQLRVNTLFRN